MKLYVKLWFITCLWILSFICPAGTWSSNLPDPDSESISNKFSLDLWGGSFTMNQSRTRTHDTTNSINSPRSDIEDDFWVVGLHLCDIPMPTKTHHFSNRPERQGISKKGIFRWLSGGLDLLFLGGDYTVAVTQGGNQQKSEIDFNTLALVGTLKISLPRATEPDLSPGVRPVEFYDYKGAHPYAGIGFGPAWTKLTDSRTTTLGANPPTSETDAVWDTSNLFEAFIGCQVYLSRRLYFTLEYRWVHLTHEHTLFPDAVTGHHTAKVKTYFRDWLSAFGVGLRF